MPEGLALSGVTVLVMLVTALVASAMNRRVVAVAYPRGRRRPVACPYRASCLNGIAWWWVSDWGSSGMGYRHNATIQPGAQPRRLDLGHAGGPRAVGRHRPRHAGDRPGRIRNESSRCGGSLSRSTPMTGRMSVRRFL